MAPFVELLDISKNFSGVKALSGVSLWAFASEVLALVGENGAGKSTLMNILSGVYADYDGKISIAGTVRKFSSPLDAEAAGITIIHQELSSFADLTVAENMWVGHWPLTKGLVSWEKMKSQASHWLNQVGSDIDPLSTMGGLSTGSKQLVEIAKALAKNSKLIIFDEPTSSLTNKECDVLFKVIRQLRKDGKAIIYISHKMEEVFSLADRVTVLRDGKSVFSALKTETSDQEIIRHMVGRSLDQFFPEPPKRDYSKLKPILEVKDLEIQKPNGSKVGPISFSVRPGEILGFAGLLGAGRSEMAQALFGRGNQDFQVSGEVSFKNQIYSDRSPRESLRRGLALVSEDRKDDSIFAERSLDENVSISRLLQKSLFAILKLKFEEKKTDDSLLQLKTRHSSRFQSIRELSGGNQQKVVLGRILQTSPEVIILDEPTRGVDVGAKFEIYQILFELAAQGKALIVISSDLPELTALADRVIVLGQGKMRGELPREKFAQDLIMQMAVST